RSGAAVHTVAQMIADSLGACIRFLPPDPEQNESFLKGRGRFNFVPAINLGLPKPSMRRRAVFHRRPAGLA
ncbi:MAG: hypothetical protein LW715_09070, partial [Rhodobacter sp.]|nr:hypothetical protein [Rhodobacter sp.]